MNQKRKSETNNTQVIQNMEFALNLLRDGRISDAYDLFINILNDDYSNLIAETGLKICKYWANRLSTIENATPYNKGKMLYDEWKRFEKHLEVQKNISMKVVNAIMFFVFNTALQYLKKDIQDNRIIDIPVLFLTGMSYKKIGDFSNAIIYFERVIKNDRNNSNAYANLADCYALIDEDKKAKVLFREAFFIDPYSIDIESLDSNMIHALTHQIKEFKIPKDEFNFWIPVYGRVLNIFNIKRDLLAVEVGKIRQEIFQLEQELYKSVSDDEITIARLINYYLWLYDYYYIKKPEDEILIELEEKIKNLSIKVYTNFKNNMIQEIK